MNTYIIVGAGLFGITLAQCLCEYNKVILIEKRNVIGGNCFDYTDKSTGITIHKYGPHIFHIQDKNIYEYVTKFTKFNNYKHQVRSYYRNKVYEFPINLATINSFYGVNLKPFEVHSFLEYEAQKSKIHHPQNMAEKIISLIGEKLFKAFFKEYTIKQWGKDPYQLPANIIDRIPIKTNYDTSYYKKPFNGIPLDGFSSMFSKMLDHKNISIYLNTNFLDDINYFSNKGTVIFTGPIDSFFDYKYGKLAYRSLKFEEEYYDIKDFQGIAVINYPELEYAYTRICEPKHFYPEREKVFHQDRTLIFKEIPYSSDEAEPYYPIQDISNIDLYKKYNSEAQRIDNVYFGGRLGEYKYYDMEDTIKSAIKLSKQLLTGKSKQ